MLQFDLQFYEELTVAWVRTVKFISGAFFWPTGQLVFFLKSLLVACPTHTNPPGSGLCTGGILFDKHIDKSTQQMN